MQKFLETTIAKNKKINNESKTVEEKVIAFFAYIHDDWNLTTEYTAQQAVTLAAKKFKDKIWSWSC